MFQIATPILNEIAKTQKIKTNLGWKIFKADPDDFFQVMEEFEKDLEQNYPKASDKVILAAMTIGPVMLEQEAITNYIIQTEEICLRGALPDVSDPEEAVYLMTMDKRLTQEEQGQLLKILENLN